jgi:rhomboid protease GluP
MSASDDHPEWIETLARAAGRAGLSEMRTRWRLINAHRKLVTAFGRSADRARHTGYAHKMCPACGALQSGDEQTCPKCGEAVGHAALHVASRLGVALPSFVTTTSVLSILILVVWVRMLTLSGDGIWSFTVETLYSHGGIWRPAVWGGQPWRLGSAIFLHAGLWHLGFNLIALSQVGPMVEELFGRTRTFVFFVVTGLFASFVTHFFMMGIGIGASGAVMGLIGVAAGWGHRDGTTIGKSARDRMLGWALYCLVFGFFIGADNVAHTAGFVLGAALGYAMPPAWRQRPTLSTAMGLAFALCLLAVGIAVSAALVPLGGAPPWIP